MLQLILGIAGSGKTTRMLEELEKRAAAGKASIWLVPEQFSSSAETMMYQRLGDAGSALAEVVSFRTLAERIFKTSGGLAARVLGDAGRVVYVRRALDALGDGLRTFSRHRRSAAFCSMCADTIGELKTAGATPALLRDIARTAQEPKFDEISLIFEAYEAQLAGTAMDPEDRLTQAAAKAGCGYFTGKACFIDNFDGFTAPEYALLAQVLAHCEGVFAALCCDALHERDGGLGLFSPVRRTAQHLLRLAAKAGRPAAAPLVLEAPLRAEESGLAALNLLLAGGEEPEDGNARGLRLTGAADEWEEVRLVAAEMRRLALTGVPYSRMAVVCRDIAAYESVVRRQFGLFGIPYFVDATATIEYTAPVAFLRAALALLRGGLAGGPILALLKTGLCGFAESDIAALENYVYTWNPRAAEWRQPFTKSPQGLLAAPSEAAQRQLAAAEGLRAGVVPALEEFIRKGRGRKAQALSRRLYLLMDRFGAAQHAEENAAALEAAGEAAMADAARRAWDLAMDLLDQMALLLAGETLAPAEYDDLLLLLVRATDFGQLPQSLECAVFTSADRMRLASPDYCFVLGLAEGEFPMQVGYSGLLTHADRDLLVTGGVEMPGSFENRTLLEEMFFYRALTSCRRGLYASWPQRRGGAAKAMASALERVKAAFAPPPLAPSPAEEAATPAAAFDRLGTLYRDNTPEAAALHTALARSGRGEAAALLAMLQKVDNAGEFAVADEAAIRQLVGREMVLSATRAERYYQCRFSYFMERVLGVHPRQKAEFSPLEGGTFVHHVLEQVLREAGEGFGRCTDEQLAEMCARHADAFIAENLPDATRRAAYLLGQIKESTARLLCFMRDDAAQSDFVVDAVELPLGEEGGVAPLRVETPGGRVVRVTGKIDRVDVLRRDGHSYLRIVDYKTGGKKFSLDDVYCGLNMQMMIYMYALCQNGGERYPNPVPAGVLYLTGDPAPSSGGRAEAKTLYEVDGLVLEDPAILRAMDKEGQGVFLPVKHKAGVPGRAGKKLASLEKMGGIQRRVQQLLADMADGVYKGDFAANPLVKKQDRPCKWCAYRAACRHEDGRHETEICAPEDAFALPAAPEGGERP